MSAGVGVFGRSHARAKLGSGLHRPPNCIAHSMNIDLVAQRIVQVFSLREEAECYGDISVVLDTSAND